MTASDETPTPSTGPQAKGRRHLIIAVLGAAAVAAAVVIGVVVTRSNPMADAAMPDLSECQEQQTEELYVQYLYGCSDSNVYTFATSGAGDQWRSIAEQLGAVVFDKGLTWLRVKP